MNLHGIRSVKNRVGQQKGGRKIGSSNRNTTKSLCSPNTSDLYWAAGFIEGEGCFQFNGGSGEVNAGQSEEYMPLLKLQRLFGGSVGDPIIRKSYKPKRRWVITGPRARGVMMTLYPILSPRRQVQIYNILKG